MVAISWLRARSWLWQGRCGRRVGGRDRRTLLRLEALEGRDLPNATISTIAGNGTFGDSSNGSPATNANVNRPSGVAVDGSGDLFLVDGHNVIREVSPTGIITTIAGDGLPEFGGDGGQATNAELAGPVGVAVDGNGDVFIADTSNNRIREVNPSGIITTVAGGGNNGLGDGGPATNAQLGTPTGLAVDGSGDLFIADSANRRIREVSPAGIIRTIAGTGTFGFSGDGGPATNAQFTSPIGVAVDSSGDVFIADRDNNRIREVSPSGVITTFAGIGPSFPSFGGLSGDGGPATNAQLNDPTGVVVDGSGDVFIADRDNNRIREVSPSGIITTIAGSGSTGFGSAFSGGFSGDGGPATNAQLNFPFGVAVDGSGDVFIADLGNNLIRKVSGLTPFNFNNNPNASGIAAFDPSSGTWYLRNAVSIGVTQATQFAYGLPGWVGVLGHWSGKGSDTVGVVDPSTGTWYLRNEDSSGAADAGTFQYGLPGWIPVVGDWTGSGHTGIGMFDPATATWYLRNEASAGAPDAGVFRYGLPGWLPVAGDWTGAGHAGIGVFDPGSATWYLRNEVSTGVPDAGQFVYGMPGWKPVVGDWDGNGTATVGVFDPAHLTWYLRNEDSSGPADAEVFSHGASSWQPLAGLFSLSATLTPDAALEQGSDLSDILLSASDTRAQALDGFFSAGL
jgi:hypothetical protein